MVSVGMEEGDFVIDTCTGRVGCVMGHDGPCLQLRPVGGGREWGCDPDDARPATVVEIMHAKVAAANALSRRGR
ncbi:hypothetical protein J7E96_10500 [Streptomyces sp. ISL-96]|uniref:hypothetical protein n=1 Tax=Streptomyces sp. ISL-96 TaxID=2819191 RepID=UPI001BE867F6|nr:hypothetical protein [Streptomyces sp. ISL-96]MBT2488946.1 hypothetical protein [Streptomyces sp. ISL-96]